MRWCKSAISSRRPDLDKARAWGIEPGFKDFKGEWRTTAPETERALLEAMGAEDPRPPSPRALVVRRGDRLERGGSFEVQLEDGSRSKVDDRGPVELPTGYHTLLDPSLGDEGEVPLIVSPGRCYLPEDLDTWGWGVQLYSVHSQRSWGIGDLDDLARLGTWARGLGAGMLLLNPLHAAAPGQASPYFPSSRSFRNPIYLSVEAVAAEMSASIAEHTSTGRALNDTDVVERQAAYDIKLAVLEELWAEWQPSSSDFDRFRNEMGDSLTRFATYMTIAEEYGWGTNEWPDELKGSPNEPAVAQWRERNQRRVLFHEWLQWLLKRQLERAESQIDIVHDLAIGVDPGGADAWLWNDAFAHAVTVGAPPDEFAAGGQDWGMPPFDPWRLRSQGYEPFIRTVRAGLSSGSGLRVDHVMGLFRLWWIPHGAPATEGAYVRYPAADLLNILALESERARSYVIGEDLGTVEPEVRDEMAARNMLSYRVMWFESAPPEDFPELALAAATNHDLPTIAGVWTGADLREQKEIGVEVDEGAELQLRERLTERAQVDDDAPVADVIERTYRALSKAPSRVKVATLEDALAVERKPNQPGTMDERPNWSLRLPAALEELDDADLPRRIARALGD